MTADEIADELVTHFNAISDPLIAFQAIVPDDVEDIEKERTDFVVFVVPTGESEEPFDRGDTCNEERVISVVVSGPIKTVTKRLAMQFGEQLRRSLRETEFQGYRWSGNETTTLIDYNALKTKGQFLSRFDATYFALA